LRRAANKDAPLKISQAEKLRAQVALESGFDPELEGFQTIVS